MCFFVLIRLFNRISTKKKPCCWPVTNPDIIQAKRNPRWGTTPVASPSSNRRPSKVKWRLRCEMEASITNRYEICNSLHELQKNGGLIIALLITGRSGRTTPTFILGWLAGSDQKRSLVKLVYFSGLWNLQPIDKGYKGVIVGLFQLLFMGFTGPYV